ncbi:unnamed protein product [Miscanthus lutarioriparius]|uniref:Uncharacterized protein n=1 Tax=Miscanthus lutarioriparius TaxID=422564 RepID=A0A811MUR1_9POAL|nr:unnamed protein product [Miscanthus lutarioriparius]
MAEPGLEGSQPVDLSKHPSGIVPTLHFLVLGTSKRANIVLNCWGFGGNDLVVILSRRVDFRCEHGQTEGARAWGSSELKASRGEMDGEYAAHWASTDDKSGVSSSMGRAGLMTSSGHTRSLVGQIEHSGGGNAEISTPRSWANGLGRWWCPALGHGAVRCWATVEISFFVWDLNAMGLLVLYQVLK